MCAGGAASPSTLPPSGSPLTTVVALRRDAPPWIAESRAPRPAFGSPPPRFWSAAGGALAGPADPGRGEVVGEPRGVLGQSGGVEPGAHDAEVVDEHQLVEGSPLPEPDAMAVDHAPSQASINRVVGEEHLEWKSLDLSVVLSSSLLSSNHRSNFRAQSWMRPRGVGANSITVRWIDSGRNGQMAGLSEGCSGQLLTRLATSRMAWSGLIESS